MSFLQKKGKGKLDDTIPLKCTITGFLNIDGHTEFTLKVQRGANADNSWEVRHRYNDFAALNCMLTSTLIGIDVPFPPKKAFGNMDSTFLQERRFGLQEFMNAILSNGFFSHNLAVKKFLDPHNYSDEIERTAQQQAAMFFRSEPKWELQENLKEIGWRVRKDFFTIKSKDGSKATKHLLTWVEHGPDMVLDYQTTLLGLLHQMISLQHPFIHPITYASCTEKGATIVRQLHTNGSLRDVICKAKPNHPRLKKYGNLRVRIPLEFVDIKRIGRQVLEALKFLHEKSWPYGNLHAGNVVVDGQDCKLLDVENGVLGLPSIYRAHMMELKVIKDLESIDVYCFGHFLYEITFGMPLEVAHIGNLPEECPPIIQPILHSILSSTAVKSALPTIQELITNPFFADVPICYNEKPVFKVSKVKEPLRIAREAIENRLKEDQKRFRQFNRLSKARSELLSEEEKKKRKKSAKKKSASTSSKPMADDGKAKGSSNSSRSNSSKQSNVPPPPPPPSAQPPPPPSAPSSSVQAAKTKPPSTGKGRGALLTSISGFSKTGLKKATTSDRSAPKV